jgi:hypothetical protein
MAVAAARVPRDICDFLAAGALPAAMSKGAMAKIATRASLERSLCRLSFCILPLLLVQETEKMSTFKTLNQGLFDRKKGTEKMGEPFRGTLLKSIAPWARCAMGHVFSVSCRDELGPVSYLKKLSFWC